MKQTRLLMGMPITVEVVDTMAKETDIDDVFSYFSQVDKRFSTYKEDSEISQINRGEILSDKYSPDMKEVFSLSEETKQQTHGYFDISYQGRIDPSGLVKGWAIYHAALLLAKKGYRNYYVEAGGDIQVNGKNEEGGKWRVGIKNPFAQEKIVKVVFLSNEGIATSGTYIRGQHIYNPLGKKEEITDVASVTVIGKTVYDADRFATAAFAMGERGILFLEGIKDIEGYMIDNTGMATMTSGFEAYTKEV